jgi:thiol-disulfide isomerase/thioredoxin
MSDTVREIHQSEFDTAVAQASGPVVLDFFSSVCPPCEALAPKYEALAAQFGDRVRFLKVFRQGNRELAQRLGVTGSPTLLFFQGGAEVGDRLTGDIKRSELKERLAALAGS